MSAPQAAPQPAAPAKSFLTEKLPTLIAITTLILAVCATLASFKAAGYGNRTVLCQTQASDQWAYYQAKSIKETTYQVQRDTLAFIVPPPGQEQAYADKIKEFDKEIARYKAEKKEIMQDAQKLEKERDTAQGFSMKLGQAIIFLQIGILMSSLASINKVAYYWYMAVASGGAGIAMFIHTMILTL
jgi:hypothetical protein